MNLNFAKLKHLQELSGIEKYDEVRELLDGLQKVFDIIYGTLGKIVSTWNKMFEIATAERMKKKLKKN